MVPFTTLIYAMRTLPRDEIYIALPRKQNSAVVALTVPMKSSTAKRQVRSEQRD